MTNAEGEITHNTLVSSDTEDTRKFSKKDPGIRKYPSYFNAGNIYRLYGYLAHTDTVNKLSINREFVCNLN
jgi:hypothetical protein